RPHRNRRRRQSGRARKPRPERRRPERILCGPPLIGGPYTSQDAGAATGSVVSNMRIRDRIAAPLWPFCPRTSASESTVVRDLCAIGCCLPNLDVIPFFSRASGGIDGTSSDRAGGDGVCAAGASLGARRSRGGD